MEAPDRWSRPQSTPPSWNGKPEASRFWRPAAGALRHDMGCRRARHRLPPGTTWAATGLCELDQVERAMRDKAIQQRASSRRAQSDPPLQGSSARNMLKRSMRVRMNARPLPRADTTGRNDLETVGCHCN